MNFPELSGRSVAAGASTERSWLARTYLDAGRMGVDRVSWYAYAEVPDYLTVDLRSPAVSPAFAAVSAWMTDAYFVGCTDDWQSLGGVSWSVTSSLLVSTAPVWLAPSDQAS